MLKKIKIIINLLKKERNKVMKYVVKVKIEINTLNVVNNLLKTINGNETYVLKYNIDNNSYVNVVECTFICATSENVMTDNYKEFLKNKIIQECKELSMKNIELSFHKLEIMDDSNNHNKILIDIINECFKKDVERFNKIVSLFIHRDCDECEELNINTEIDKITENDIHNYLMNVANNEDLNMIINIFCL